MPKRYIGDAIVTIDYMEDDTYAGNIKAGGYTWKFDGLRAPAVGLPYAYDSPEAYDKLAGSAVSFGAYEDERSDVAMAISDAVSGAQDDQGNYDVKRKKPKAGNPVKKSKKAKYTGVLADDIPELMLEVLVDGTVQDVEWHTGTSISAKEKAEIEKIFIKNANAFYAGQQGKKLAAKSPEAVRDQLRVYMEHWLAAYLKKNDPTLFKKLPSGYGWSYSPYLEGAKEARKRGKKPKAGNPMDSNPRTTIQEKVDEITSWVMNDEGLYNRYLTQGANLRTMRHVAADGADMAGIRDMKAIARASKELREMYTIESKVGNPARKKNDEDDDDFEEDRGNKFTVVLDDSGYSYHDNKEDAVAAAVALSQKHKGLLGGPRWIHVLSPSGDKFGCIEVKARKSDAYCSNPASSTSALKNKLLR